MVAQQAVARATRLEMTRIKGNPGMGFPPVSRQILAGSGPASTVPND